MTDIRRVARGGRLYWSSGLVGLAGMAATLVSLALSPHRTAASYLVAYVYWSGIAISAVLLVATFHAASARWVVVLRRLLEAMTATLPLFAILFIPIALNLPHLFSWARPGADLGHGDPVLLRQKADLWLNPPLFLSRTALYFVIWIGVAEVLYFWSRRQDESSDVRLTARERKLGAGALPALGLAMTFAAFDWLMSLSPAWGTTIFGLYWFSGSFLAAHALLIVVVAAAEQTGWLEGRIRPAHYHSLGKLTFAFVCFWSYIAFSQFMLIWIGNEPSEIVWYRDRFQNGFLATTLVLVATKFVVPFFVLLSRAVKTNPRALSFVALWILSAHYVDIYWLVMPATGHGAHLRWPDISAFIGIGGVAIAFAKWRLEGRRIVPACDPYLRDSLGYTQP